MDGLIPSTEDVEVDEDLKRKRPEREKLLKKPL